MKNILNEEEIQKSIKKIKMYKEQEELILEDLKSKLKTINYNYTSNNEKSLVEKENEVINKFATIIKRHNNNILILQKNLTKYKNTSKKVRGMFDNI